MLFPQQMATGRNMLAGENHGFSRHSQDKPPRLVPISNRPSLRESVDEDAIEYDEDSYMEEEDSREAPQLSVMFPDSITTSLSVKTEGEMLDIESMRVQKPQIQEYLKKLSAQGVKIRFEKEITNYIISFNLVLPIYNKLEKQALPHQLNCHLYS